MDKTKIYLDLTKCTEEERKYVFSLLPEPKYSNQYIIDFGSTYKLSFFDGIWWVFNRTYNRTEVTYPEFIKLFEGGEGENQTFTKEDIEKAYRAGENKQTYYFKDTTVILPTTYEGVDG